MTRYGVFLIGLWTHLAGPAGAEADSVPMQYLELPRLAGLSVEIGEAAPLEELFGATTEDSSTDAPVVRVPIPIVPKEC